MAADRQRIEGFLRRGVRAGYHRANQPTAAELVEDLDGRLFNGVRYDSHHVLQSLLPNRRTDTDFLRQRRHDFQLFCKSNSITDCDFIARLLFKDSYRP